MVELNDDTKLLEMEYRELCSDWRQRDAYVLNKLSGAGILFSLIGLALANLNDDQYLIKLVLAGAGAFFSLILTISVTKDTRYRDGTEALIRLVGSKLGIPQALAALKDDPIAQNKITVTNLDIPRKVKVPLRQTSLVKGPRCLMNWLDRRTTFRWILSFYLLCCLAFIALFVLVLVDTFSGVTLPI